MSANLPSDAYNAATKQVIASFKEQQPEKWAQILGDAREALGLPREGTHGRHGTFRAWVRHIEQGDQPCRLCTEAMLQKMGSLEAPADPVPTPKKLACEDCDFTSDHRSGIAMHVRRKHGRALTPSEMEPAAHG